MLFIHLFIDCVGFRVNEAQDREPDLLGLPEVENKDVLQELINRVGRDKCLIADYS